MLAKMFLEGFKKWYEVVFVSIVGIRVWETTPLLNIIPSAFQRLGVRYFFEPHPFERCLEKKMTCLLNVI